MNGVTVPFAGGVPQIDELVRAVRGKEVFSTFDLANAYHQMSVHEQDQEKTTFVTHQGTYKFT